MLYSIKEKKLIISLFHFYIYIFLYVANLVAKLTSCHYVCMHYYFFIFFLYFFFVNVFFINQSKAGNFILLSTLYFIYIVFVSCTMVQFNSQIESSYVKTICTLLVHVGITYFSARSQIGAKSPLPFPAALVLKCVSPTPEHPEGTCPQFPLC